jgi:penicillin-binding protein 1A
MPYTSADRQEKQWILYSFIAVATLLLLFVVYLVFLSRSLPSLSQLENYQPRLATRVLARDGTRIKELYTQKRFFVPLDSIPPFAVQAVIATEDRKFYDHWGINLLTIARAALVNLTSLGIRQGASTLTQQLAWNLYLTHRRTYTRKIREALTAIEIERTYSKREILEMYLTQTYFGNGAYGIGAAAMKYFSKSVQELTLSEAAMLIGLLKAPGVYSPTTKPNAALARRNIILNNMRVCGYLTDSQYKAAVKEPIVLNMGEEMGEIGTAPYFTEMVRQELDRRQEKYGFDTYGAGLTVETTLDPALQRFAERAVEEQLPEVQRRVTGHYLASGRMDFILHKFPTADSTTLKGIPVRTLTLDSMIRAETVVQVAVVAIDPLTGDILAMIGGRDFQKYKFNRAIQARRQPGSSFKPFSYIAAIDNGYPLTTKLLNQDVVATLPGGKRWTPQNYDLSRGGPTTLREALRRSLNLVTVHLVTELIKPVQVVSYAHQMGIESPLDTVTSLALGCSGVTPLELVSAYSSLAGKGLRAKPMAIRRIDDRYGNIVEENFPKRDVVLSEETAFLITSLLETVINRGTGAPARTTWGFRAPAAGKTGTTNDFTDAWFIGFTPKIAVGVWVGLDDPGLSLGKNATGAVIALPIWATFMNQVYDSLGWAWDEFEMPSGVVELEVCEDSGQLASPYCPRTYKEVFNRKNQPHDLCPLHSRFHGNSH